VAVAAVQEAMGPHRSLENQVDLVVVVVGA
jgi:hypothetical protein